VCSSDLFELFQLSYDYNVMVPSLFLNLTQVEK
jgi:hypothetical protein